jgi:predicted cobalt transporter CbtA
MVGSLLIRGMLVGLFAGLLAFGFARTFGEPPLDRAIAFEEHAGHSHHHGAAGDAAAAEPEAELVSRATQAGLGLFVGILVYGAAIGGLFSLVFAFVHGRVGRLGARATAAIIALCGFVALVLVPALKYPPNPPAIGDPATIGPRTQLFFIMLAASLAAAIVAVALARRLAARFGGWNAGLAAAAAFIVLTTVAAWALPPVDEVPASFPAVVLWQFRLASLGIHLILWAVIGLAFGALVERRAAADPSVRAFTPRPLAR